jgi:hypothetical protein
LGRFHPACNRAYAAWLKLTPWTAAKPLPLGPIHPVWQDAAVIGLLSAIAHWHAHTDPLWPVIAFVSVYLAGMTILLGVTRRWWHFLALGFLWPSLMLPVMAGTPGIIIVAAIIGVIWHGHLQSLKAFPWVFIKDASPAANPTSLGEVRINVDFTPTSGGPSALGWPLTLLSPKIKTPSVSNRTNLALSLLIGWWSYCLIIASQMVPVSELMVLFAMLAAIFRLAVYGSSVATPFNFWGRMATGRIIVPGFDRVFVTPLAVALLSVITAIIVERSGHWYPVTESCAIAAIWYLLFGGGPSLRNWILTGQLRLRPPARTNANKRMFRPV